jgi:hypothetical protein
VRRLRAEPDRCADTVADRFTDRQRIGQPDRQRWADDQRIA